MDKMHDSSRVTYIAKWRENEMAWDAKLTRISCLLFRIRSLSALISSSMVSLTRLASASLCSLSTRSCSVSEVGGLRKAVKGSASVVVEWTDGGLGVVIIAGAQERRRAGVGSREAL